jgi:uncharacterized membrane protein YphA (DoxX/SURF4 family)
MTETKGIQRDVRHGGERSRKPVNYALWIVQILLALLFLWAGVTKLITPLEKLSGPAPMPGWFIRFLGFVEVLGGLGLVLPGLFRIKPWLTPLAAAGLLVIMAGATVITLTNGMANQVGLPVIAGLLLIIVLYGRWKLFRESRT